MRRVATVCVVIDGRRPFGDKHMRSQVTLPARPIALTMAFGAGASKDARFGAIFPVEYQFALPDAIETKPLDEPANDQHRNPQSA